VESPLNQFNINNHIVGFDGGFTHPLYRSFEDNLTLGINFTVRQNRTLFFGNSCIPLEAYSDCNTQVTVLRMSQRAAHKSATNNLTFWSTFNVGLDALGATVNPSGWQQGQFFSWLGQSLFAQRLWSDGPLMVVKANLQVADKPLLSLERFALGGVNTVRGYRENTYVRDNAYNTTLEFRYPIYSAEADEKNTLNLVPFLDYGQAWNNRLSPADNPLNNQLFSSGLGFQWQFHQFTSEFYWAHAFTAVPNKVTSHNIQDDGIHFRVNMNVF
jgi:hemolysin activation/secretion protein